MCMLSTRRMDRTTHWLWHAPEPAGQGRGSGDRCSGRCNVLVVASEAGSGKAMAPVLDLLCGRGVRLRAFLAAGVVDFIAQMWPGSELARAAAPVHGRSLRDLLPEGDPNVILVGTTAGASVDRELILYGKERGIPSLTVVDERYAYRRRFGDDRGDLRYLPDAITVMDQECARDAIAQGIPADLVQVTGSPILSYLAYQYKDLRARVSDRVHPLPTGWRLVTFISETFARDNGREPGQRGLLGPFLGFTEETVRGDLLDALRKIGWPVVLLERLHPSDGSDPREAQEGSTLMWKQIRGGDLWTLLVESDVVIGMKSMALLEAAMLGCRVASYQPNLIGENRCAAVRFGVAARLNTREELRVWLESNLSTETRWLTPRTDIPFIRDDAAERVAELTLNLLGGHKDRQPHPTADGRVAHGKGGQPTPLGARRVREK